MWCQPKGRRGRRYEYQKVARQKTGNLKPNIEVVRLKKRFPEERWVTVTLVRQVRLTGDEIMHGLCCDCPRCEVFIVSQL